MSTKKSNSIDDLLEANEIILEAFEVSNSESNSIVEESTNLQSIAKSYEQYVQKFQDTWQQNWVDGITAFEKEVEGWQDAVSIFQAKTQASAQTSTKDVSPTKKPAPKSSK